MDTIKRENVFDSDMVIRTVSIRTLDKDYGTIALSHPSLARPFWQKVEHAFNQHDPCDTNMINIETTIKGGCTNELPLMHDFTTTNFDAAYKPTDRLEAIRLYRISYAQLDSSPRPDTLTINCIIELILHFDNNGNDAVTDLSIAALVQLDLKTGQLRIMQ